MGEALNPLYTLHKQAHPVKVNVWACFSAAGQGFSYIFSDNLDAPLTKKILSENLNQSADDLFEPGGWWLLHDNDKKFKSKLVTDWLFNNGVQVLDFPPYSPDLNPIEKPLEDLGASSRRSRLRYGPWPAGRCSRGMGQHRSAALAQPCREHA